MNSFMSSIKSAVSGAGDGTKSTLDQSSNTDLVSSVKLVAEAAQCATTNQTDKIDKPKVAGATADLLDSVKQYGKFDESQGVGQYIKQADDYLHQYEKSSGAGGTDATPSLQAPEATHVKEVKIPTLEEEQKKEALTPLKEQKDEVPVLLKEPKDDALTRVEEQGGKEEFGGGYEEPASLEEQKDEKPVSLHEKKDETLAHANEMGGKEEFGGGYEALASLEEQKDETPVSLHASANEKDGKEEFGGGYEAPASLEEQNHETPVSLHEKKDETPAPLDEKSGKEEYASGFGTKDAFKAAGSFFK
ncbi:hypothetical protein R6Q57_014921 [Mikania cordata]